MTTLTACRKALKQKSFTEGLLITHNAGHVDRRGIDRGYTVMSMQDAVAHVAAYPDTVLYERNCRLWTSPWPLAEVVAARSRGGLPIQ